jgi:hypothetical protein
MNKICLEQLLWSKINQKYNLTDIAKSMYDYWIFFIKLTAVLVRYISNIISQKKAEKIQLFKSFYFEEKLNLFRKSVYLLLEVSNLLFLIFLKPLSLQIFEII